MSTAVVFLRVGVLLFCVLFHMCCVFPHCVVRIVLLLVFVAGACGRFLVLVAGVAAIAVACVVGAGVAGAVCCLCCCRCNCLLLLPMLLLSLCVAVVS